MTIRITWKRVVGLLLALFVAGMAFAWSGLFQVAASSGHWGVTNWFLHWVMRNSVATYSWWQAPDRVTTDQALVSAAGHFRQSCQSCHGAPGVPPSPVMQRATPHAPDLARTAPEWKDRELFWILRHGVKYSGMPAWGADDRPDEVRRMVAFVRRLPTLSPAAYRALTEVPPAADLPGLRPGVLATCTGCHGVDGRGRGQPDIPVLGGQLPAYLLASLHRYARGDRASAVMQEAAHDLTLAEMRILARHFAAMPGLAGGGPGGRAPRDDRAAAILTRGLPDRQLPACASCHAPGRAYPVLAGQRAGYIADRIHHWRGDEKVVDARKPHDTMPVIARRIPEDAIEPLARALSGEPPPP